MSYDEILTRMQERYRELTGFSADNASDIGIRLKVLAEQVELLYQKAEELGREVFPQTSTGENLERHAECRGLSRKPAASAAGTLRFSRETAATADIQIPQGILCATRTEPQVQFETAVEAVLEAGETEILVPARALEAGGTGNVSPGAVCLMVSAAPGITAVSNPEMFTGGADAESDDALRERLLTAYRNISNGTNAAYYYDIAMQQEGVRSAAVLPRVRGRGTVDVVISGAGDEAEQAAARTLQETFDHSKEINVDVLVYAAQRRTLTVTAQIAPLEGYDFDEVAAACADAAVEEIEAFGVGEPLLLAKLTGHLMEVPGVYNARIASPDSDVFVEDSQILCAGSCLIERMVGV